MHPNELLLVSMGPWTCGGNLPAARVHPLSLHPSSQEPVWCSARTGNVWLTGGADWRTSATSLPGHRPVFRSTAFSLSRKKDWRGREPLSQSDGEKALEQDAPWSLCPTRGGGAGGWPCVYMLCGSFEVMNEQRGVRVTLNVSGTGVLE